MILENEILYVGVLRFKVCKFKLWKFCASNLKKQYSDMVSKHLGWLSPTQLPPSPPPIPHQDTGEVVPLLLLADEVGYNHPQISTL